MSMTRRSLFSQFTAAAVLSPAPGVFSAADARESADAASRNARGGEGITRRYVEFLSRTTFEQLPPEVVHAATRFVLDSVGCAVAGWTTHKGRIAASVMKSAGGVPDAHILGTDARVSAANAAFANAELMNALDYDAIPHTPPVTVPAVLALAERERAPGRSVLLATVLAHELASRLAGASSEMGESIRNTGHTPSVFDINTEAIIAAAGAGATLSGQTQEQIASALGLAAYYCPPQAAHDWETVSPKTDVKYTPVGIICQGAVTAALLSRQGYTSNPAVLDGATSFPTFYGYRRWEPRVALGAMALT